MGMEEPLEPNGATISWLRLVQSAPVSAISRTPKCSKVGAIAENTVWEGLQQEPILEPELKPSQKGP